MCNCTEQTESKPVEGPKFRITGAKGFQITFENGWTVSVQFGYGNYCDNKHDRSTLFGLDNALTQDVECANAEVARWYKDETMEEPDGWLTPAEVVAFINDTANFTTKENPVTHKILYSPGWGAGWLTWAHSATDEQRRFILTYEPLIAALENGDDIGFVNANSISDDKYRPGSPLDQFVKDWIAQWGDEDVPYLGGARDLAVYEVSGPFRIDEYDGNESVIEAREEQWITL